MTNNLIFIFSSLLIALLTLLCVKNKHLLIAWIALMGILANLFVVKQINLFGFHATASDIYAVGSILGLNLMREYYDLKSCKQTIFVSFACMILFMLMGQIHLLYAPSALDSTQAAYETLLVPNPRIITASLIVFFSVQLFDVFFYNHFVRKAFKALWLRNSFSLIVSQGLDTALFTYIGLYGLMSNLDEILLISFAIKLIAIACMVPLTTLSKQWIKI